MIIPERDKLLLAIKYDLLEGIFFEDTLYKTMICGIKAVEELNGDFYLVYKFGALWFSTLVEYSEMTEKMVPLVIRALIEDKISINSIYER